MRSVRSALVLLAVAALGAVGAGRAYPDGELSGGGYQAVVLDGGPETPLVTVNALNAADTAAGWATDGDAAFAAGLWDLSTARRLPLQALPDYPQARAFDVNDGGAAAGHVFSGTGARAVLWGSRSAAPLDLGTLGGASSTALGLNEAQEVVGLADTASELAAPFYRAAGGSMVALPRPAGSAAAQASEISDSGVIIGWGADGSVTRPLAWNGPASQPVALPMPPGATLGQPLDIADDGTLIVGFCREASGTFIGARWERGGDGAYALTAIRGAGSVYLSGLNGDGDAVGRMDTPDGPRGILVRAGATQPIDLNTLLAPGAAVTVTRTVDINGSGTILGYALPAGSQNEQAVLLATRVPDLRGDWKSVARKQKRRGRHRLWSLTGRIRISNQGTAAAGSFRAQVYLSGDREPGGDQALAQKTFTGLAAGNSTLWSWQHVFPASAPNPRGQFLYVLVDDGGQVAEPDEANNRALFRSAIR